MAMSGVNDALESLAQLSEATIPVEAAGPSLPFRGFSQLLQETEALAKKRRVDETKATTFLTKQDFNMDKFTASLGSIHLGGTFVTTEAVAGNVDTYLAHQNELMIHSAIEDARKLTQRSFEECFNARLEKDWKTAKAEFLRETTTAPLLPPMPGTRPESAMAPESLSPEMARFVNCLEQKIELLRQHNQAGRYFPIIQNFMDVWQTFAPKTPEYQHLYQSWNALRCILQETPLPKPPKDTPQTLNLVKGSLTFLESEYDQHIKEVVIQNPEVARVGGIPGPAPKVKGFLRVMFREQIGKSDQVPVWALLFFLIRAGHSSAALQVATAEMPTDRVVQWLREYEKDGFLSEESATQCKSEYNRLFKSGVSDAGASSWLAGPAHATSTSPGVVDKFQQALYLVLGRCDDHERLDAVFPTVEDYIWLKLKLLNPRDCKPMYEKLQKNIIHWNDSRCFPNPFVFFHFLILTGQFEEAIRQLLSIANSALYREAVHFAIAMDYYRCLRLPPTGWETQLYGTMPDSPNAKFLNFPLLLQEYTKQYATTNVRLAVQYLCLLAVDDRIESAIESFVQLVHSTSGYSALIGELGASGEIKIGILGQYLGGDSLLKNVAVRCAQDAEQKGQSEKAVELFLVAKFLSKDEDFRDRILTIMNKRISQVLNPASLSVPSTPRLGGVTVVPTSASREVVLQFAQRVENALGGDVTPAQQRVLKTFTTLLSLADFYTALNLGRLEDAYTCLSNVGLIPVGKTSAEEAKEAFENCDEEVRRHFSDLIKSSTELIRRLHDLHRAEAEAVRELRESIRKLVSLTGAIQGRISPEVHGAVLQASVAMK